MTNLREGEGGLRTTRDVQGNTAADFTGDYADRVTNEL